MAELLIGFSFSLAPDGSPGSYNEMIADRMYDAWQSSGPDKPMIGMQWEIYEAFEQRHPGALPGLSQMRDWIAGPPMFTKDDILSPGRLTQCLYTPYLPAERVLSDAVRGCPKWSAVDQKVQGGARVEASDLADLLNELLDQPRWYRDFVSVLDLTDFRRPDKGILGLEKRCLPGSDHGLGPYQRRRLNRLIVEEIIPERLASDVEYRATGDRTVVSSIRVLDRGEYLNTRGVADLVLKRAHTQGPVDLITLFCHPEHGSWCKGNVERAADSIFGTRPRVIPGGGAWATGQLWDPTTAQVWCRSQENYRRYSAL